MLTVVLSGPGIHESIKRLFTFFLGRPLILPQVTGFANVGHNMAQSVALPRLSMVHGSSRNQQTDRYLYFTSHKSMGHWNNATSTYWLLTCPFLFGRDLNFSRSTNPSPHLHDGIWQCQCAF